MCSIIPSLIPTVAIKHASKHWHYIVLLSTLILMHQYVALETFSQAVQEINISIKNNHRQHFTLIGEIARSFCVHSYLEVSESESCILKCTYLYKLPVKCLCM